MLPPVPLNHRTASICALLRALATLSSAISVVPRLRLVESNVCRTHYQTFNHSAIDPSTDAVPESLCKTAHVQTDLAFLLGWDAFFQNIPGGCVLAGIAKKSSKGHGFKARPTELTSKFLVFVVGIVYSVLSERVDRNLLLLVNVTSNVVAKGYFYAICTIATPFLTQSLM